MKQTDLPVEVKEFREALLKDYPYGLTLKPSVVTAEDILSLLDKGRLGRNGFLQAVVGAGWRHGVGLEAEISVPSDNYDQLWPDLTRDDVILNYKTVQGTGVVIPSALAMHNMKIEGTPLQVLLPALLAGNRPDTGTLIDWALLADISCRGAEAVDDRHNWQLGAGAEVVNKANTLFTDNSVRRNEGLKALATEKLQQLGVMTCHPVILQCRYLYPSGTAEEMAERMKQRIAWANNIWDIPAEEVSPKTQHAHAGARLEDMYKIVPVIRAVGGDGQKTVVKRDEVQQIMTVAVWSDNPKYLSRIRQSLAQNDDALQDIKVLPYQDIRRAGACTFDVTDNTGRKKLDGLVNPYMDEKTDDKYQLYKWHNLNLFPSYHEGTPLVLEGKLTLDRPNKASVNEFVELPSILEDALRARIESRSLSYRVTPGGVWLYQKGVDGYAFIAPDRSVTTEGEPLGHKAMLRVRQMAATQNVAIPGAVTVAEGSGLWTGKKLLFPPLDSEPWRYLMHPETGRTVLVQENMDFKGRPLYAVGGMKADVGGWLDVTDRLQDVSVYHNSDHTRSFIRCKIDGVQQPGKQLTEKEYLSFLNGAPSFDSLQMINCATRHFKDELSGGSVEYSQQQGRGR